MQEIILPTLLIVILLTIPLSYTRTDARCLPINVPCELGGFPELLDSSGIPITDIYPGREVTIQSDISTMGLPVRSYVYIVLIENYSGFTEQLLWTNGTLVRQNETVTTSISWKPEKAEDYTITVLIWNDLEKPTLFDAAKIMEVTVYPLVRILEGSSNPEQEENYSPKVITVVLGVNNTILWLNEELHGHRVVGDRGEFESTMMGSGQTWSHTFTKTGIYGYHGKPWLRGTVIVLAQSADGSVREPAIVCGDSPYTLKYTEIMKYPALIRNITNAYSASCNYFHEFIDGRNVDKIAIRIAGEQIVEGHWRTGYTVSYINNLNITLLRDSETKELFDIDVVKSADTVRNIQFNDYQEIINFAMQEELARRFLESDDYYVTSVRYFNTIPETCYEGSCALIVVYRINSGINALIQINKSFEEYPIKVSTGGFIDGTFRIRIVNDDPEPLATRSAKAGQSFDIPLQIVRLPFAKDEPMVVKLHAYVLSLKDYVSYRQVYGKLAFSVLDQLSFSTPEVEINKESDIPVNLNVSIPDDFERGTYVLAIQGHYEDKSGGTIVFLNIE